MQMNVEEFWKPFEGSADDFGDVHGKIDRLVTKWEATNRVFAWRGQTDASWSLHSSLYRKLLPSASEAKEAPDEDELYNSEGKILQDLRHWGLHMSGPSRLSVLNQLAMSQHYGAPTRLIDVTFNPWIGLWFAVTSKCDSDGRDGRLFAIDVTDRLVNENDEYRGWEDRLRRPWVKPVEGETGSHGSEEPNTPSQSSNWTASTLAWRPPRFHPRIFAQDSGFIFGGVPDSQNQWPKSTVAGNCWGIDEVRRATSLPLRVHKFEPRAGRPPKDAVYTIRIPVGAKGKIRKKLQNLFGYTHSTLFPDFPGFADYGAHAIKGSSENSRAKCLPSHAP